MKTLLLFLLIFYFGVHPLFAQNQSFVLTFDDTAVVHQVFYIDSLLDPQGIWQIGIPHKPLFDSAISNVIITMLDTMMPVNSKASLIVAIPGAGDYPRWSLLTFDHKFDFDSAGGGGDVEFSVDSGLHWHGVINGSSVGMYYQPGLLCAAGGPENMDGQGINPPAWWGNIPTDTLSTGTYYFTGRDTTWRRDSIIIGGPVPDKTNLYSVLLFRFTAFADSGSAPRGGWMIDDIDFLAGILLCPGGISETLTPHLLIYPQPVADAFTVSLSGADFMGYSISVYDLTGRELIHTAGTSAEIIIARGDAVAGSYILQVRDRSSGNTLQKKIVFD